MYVLEQQLLSNIPIVKVQKFFMYSGHIDSFDLDLAGTKKSILWNDTFQSMSIKFSALYTNFKRV